MGIQWRSPWRAAVLSAVTLTVYGLWWWFDVNRQLQRAGGQVRAWRSLAAVTVGWVGVVFPFRSVEATTTDIVAAQREAGLSPTMRTEVPLRISIAATIGLALFALSSAFPPAFFLLGWTPIAFGMLFVWYIQRELNRLAPPRSNANRDARTEVSAP
jgi:hypothetical protein